MMNHYRRQRLYIQFFIFFRRIIRRQVMMAMTHAMMTLHSVHFMMTTSHVMMALHDCTDTLTPTLRERHPDRAALLHESITMPPDKSTKSSSASRWRQLL